MAILYPIDIAETVAENLRFVAPSLWGKRALASNVKTSPRYTWVRGSDSVTNGEAIGYEDPSIGMVHGTYEVHCRAKTVRGTERLRAQLVTSLWASAPKQLWDFGPAEWLEPEHLDDSWVCIQRVVFKTPITETCLPDAPGEQGPCEAEVILAGVVFADGDTPGDGELNEKST